MSEFEIIRTNVISDVKEVRLYAETLSAIADKHPEVPANLPSFRTAIGNALTNPTSVERSHKSGHGNAFVFVDAASANRNGHLKNVASFDQPSSDWPESRRIGVIRSPRATARSTASRPVGAPCPAARPDPD